jgi:hypothetical protein
MSSLLCSFVETLDLWLQWQTQVTQHFMVWRDPFIDRPGAVVKGRTARCSVDFAGWQACSAGSVHRVLPGEVITSPGATGRKWAGVGCACRGMCGHRASEAGHAGAAPLHYHTSIH